MAQRSSICMRDEMGHVLSDTCWLCSARAEVVMGHAYGVVIVAVLIVQCSAAVVTVMAGWLHRVCVSAC